MVHRLISLLTPNKNSVGHHWRVCHYRVIHCHWIYAVTLYFKAVQFVKGGRQPDDYL